MKTKMTTEAPRAEMANFGAPIERALLTAWTAETQRQGRKRWSMLASVLRNFLSLPPETRDAICAPTKEVRQ